MRKIQVWFRPDQAELVVASLKHLRAGCQKASNLTTATEDVAKRFTTNRIDEILELFPTSDA